METFILLMEDDIFAGHEIGRREEIVLVRLCVVALFVESSFELFEVFVE